MRPGEGTATLTAGELRFAGAGLDQQLAIPLVAIHAVALASAHNGRRWWSGKVLKVSFGGGEPRVLGLRMAAADAAEWHDRLQRLVGR